MSLAYSKWCLLGLVGFARIFVQSSMSAVALLTSRDGCSTSTCTNLGSFRSKRLACAPYLIGQVWIFVSLSHRHEHHHSLRLADRSAVKPSLRRPFLIGFLNFAEVSFWLGKVCTVRKIDQNLANTYARENVITRHQQMEMTSKYLTLYQINVTTEAIDSSGGRLLSILKWAS